MGIEACRHRDLDICDVDYAWPDCAMLAPRARRVTCACSKQWVIGLSSDQRERLRQMRPRGDKRSVYELAPGLLREAPRD